MPDTFKPTAKIAANAKKGLKLRDDFGRGGTDVGVRRAEQLAAQDDVTVEDVKSMPQLLRASPGRQRRQNARVGIGH